MVVPTDTPGDLRRRRYTDLHAMLYGAPGAVDEGWPMLMWDPEPMHMVTRASDMRVFNAVQRWVVENRELRELVAVLCVVVGLLVAALGWALWWIATT